LDWLGDESKKHFMRVLEYLDEAAVPYILRNTLVRGLDYYTNTVFEIYPVQGEGSAQSALGGGGRYNLLHQEMGGRPMPAAGFALGIDRSIVALKEYNDKNKIVVTAPKMDVFFAHLGEQARCRTLKIIDELRGSGLRVGFNFCKNSLKSQLEVADSMKVPYALILGQKEVQDGSVIVRDMESGIQEIIDQKKVEPILKKKLEKV